MSDEDLRLVRSAYEAFARRDLVGVLDACHPDVEWIVPEGEDPIGGVHHGYEAVLEEFLLRFPDDPALFHSDAEELLSVDGRVVVLGHHRGAGRPGEAGWEIPFVHVWTVRDGAAVRFQGHSDSARVTRMLARLAAA